MPSYDVFVYRDFIDTIDSLHEGPAGPQLGEQFEGLNIVVVGPSVHSSRDGSAVLMHRPDATPEIRKKFSEKVDLSEA
jgi:hypothetical protein